MVKHRTIVAALAAALLLSACQESAASTDATVSGTTEQVSAAAESTSSERSEGTSEPSSAAADAAAEAVTEGATEDTKEETVLPTKEEVEAVREKAVTGMRDTAVSNLSALIMNVDRWFEQEMIYDDLMTKLSDPDSLTWNYWDKQGEIQIGWAYDGEIDKDQTMKDEGLTEDEFYEKYGQEVIADSELGADEFASRLETYADMATDTAMKEDLTTIATKARESRETHDVSYVETMYEYLHDLDYWVLNYRVEEEMTQVQDTSTLLKYYGVLHLYN